MGDLDHRFRAHLLAAEKRTDADEAFATDRRDLDHRAVLHDGRNRGDAAVREEDLANGVVPSVEDLLDLGRHGLEVRLHAVEVFLRQRREQLVLRPAVSRRRRTLRDDTFRHNGSRPEGIIESGARPNSR